MCPVQRGRSFSIHKNELFQEETVIYAVIMDGDTCVSLRQYSQLLDSVQSFRIKQASVNAVEM